MVGPFRSVVCSVFKFLLIHYTAYAIVRKWKVFLLASRSPTDSTGTRVTRVCQTVIYARLK